MRSTVFMLISACLVPKRIRPIETNAVPESANI